MIPPKNITSVTRKIHMPSVAVSFCCSSVLNCPNMLRCDALRTPLTFKFRRQPLACLRDAARHPLSRLREPVPQFVVRARRVLRVPDPADYGSRMPPTSQPESLQSSL